MSFHGIPRSCVDKGDPYHAQCLKTAELIAGTLQLKPDSFSVSFQSRFGRAEWLKPYTSSVLEEWGRQGVARADVICPGFVSDCLETLEEIAMEGKATFMKTGGKEFHAIPCLNERPEWVRAMRTLVMENLQGWLPPTSSS
jgi:ferrochelatase